MPYYLLKVKIERRFIVCGAGSNEADLQSHAETCYPGKLLQISPAKTAQEARLARLQLSQQAAQP